MKNIVWVVLGVLLTLTSCIRKQVVLEAENRIDSLATVVVSKDSLINAVFEDINSISENLARIKSRENLIAVAAETEGGNRPVETINADIAAIDRLLEENRTKIASLQHTAAQLRKANIRIDALGKTIEDLNVRLGEKSAEIEQLHEQLAQMGAEVETLTEQVAARSVEIEHLSGEKVELQNQLHTVYYIVGSEKELRDAQIIDKQGFIGRTLTVNKTGNFESFMQADSRLLTEIPIGRKRAAIVTSHPEGSYALVIDADKVVDKLQITDPQHFWETSKVLIISYK